MSGIKYYQLAKGEEMPDEFCVVRDVNGEPSEYMFYVPEAENAKLRELVRDMHAVISDRNSWWDCMCKDTRRFADRMRELGIEAER